VDALLNANQSINTDCNDAVVGVGVEHEVLVDLAKKSFAKKPLWKESTDIKMNVKSRDLSVSQYTGGKVTVIYVAAILIFIIRLFVSVSVISRIGSFSLLLYTCIFCEH